MKIYDAHIHIMPGKPDPAGFLSLMEEAGVYGAALYSLEPFLEENGFVRLENLLRWTEKYPDRLFPVFWLHPREKQVHDLIRAAAEAGVRAFKLIPLGYSVAEPDVLNLLEEIALTGLPMIFHSGILYDYEALPTAQDNRPILWEHLLQLKTPFTFSLAHCSWPWTDECIALMGKMNYIRDYPPEARERYEQLCHRRPPHPDMYVDTTPGPAAPWRDDLFKKLFFTDPTASHVMFGSDRYTDRYHPSSMKRLIEQDTRLCQAYAAASGTEAYFGGTLLKFLKRS